MTKEALLAEYAEWSQLPDGIRRTSGMPTSDTDWCKAKGIPTRTWARYKADPTLPALQDAARAKLALALPLQTLASGDAPPRSPEPVPLDDRETYSAVSDVLERLALQGDKAALDLYFKTKGKPFILEEQAQRTSDFASLSDEELAGKTLAFFSNEDLAAELTARGWVFEGSPS